MTSTAKSVKPASQSAYQTEPERPEPPPLDRRQAYALQRLVWQRFVTIDALPPDSPELDLHERAVALLCKLADAWRSLVSEKRDLRGIPRAGSLSPAERAAMRQRKASRSSSAPKVSRPVPQPSQQDGSGSAGQSRPEQGTP